MFLHARAAQALAVVVYNGQWVRLNEIIRIPLLEYLAVFVFAGLIGGGLWLARRLSSGKRRPYNHAEVT